MSGTTFGRPGLNRLVQDATGYKINLVICKDLSRRGVITSKQASIRRHSAVGLLPYGKLYEDNAMGKVNDEWFMQLSNKYGVERMELKAKISDLRNKLMQSGEKQKEREHFIKAIRKFMPMERLTAPLLRELIDKIEVFETEGVDKNRTQRIAIYYRFVGYIELPEGPPIDNYKADTRKGVAVEYISKLLSA